MDKKKALRKNETPPVISGSAKTMLLRRVFSLSLLPEMQAAAAEMPEGVTVEVVLKMGYERHVYTVPA